MDLLTRQHFERSMQQVMERLDKQNELLLSLNRTDNKPLSLHEEVRLFDNQEL